MADTITNKIIQYMNEKKNRGFLPWELIGEVPANTSSGVYSAINHMRAHGKLIQKFDGKYYLIEVKK
ncbi:hypothetical protein LCGC14_0174680 [marine sediment metagenome]|uniref:HTH HARE-type domain-containing protein n=1 Tax=marine sediment metagenome TaxID=412755 RepID=A0A0F9UV29_9ZZZZ